jgi:hypothetical protein
MKLFGSNPKYLNLFRPPCGKYIEGLAEKVISFFESRVKNPTALRELLSSHAYRFRHPNAFIEKCFIHFSKSGNTGKSLLAAILGLMYGKYANTAAQQQQLEGKFTGWAQDLLMVHVEELQNDNYRNHHFERIIKQMTTRNASGEKKFKDVEGTINNAIIGLNTNKEDLYGLIRGDEALVTRLVILMFKDKGDINWDQFKTDIGLNDKIHTDQDRYNLGYTMYTYLKTKYDIKPNFNPCRYYDKEKYEIINELQKKCNNSIEKWIRELTYDNDPDESIPAQYRILLRKSIYKEMFTCIKLVKRDILKSYTHFLSENKSLGAFGIDKVIETLISKGFAEVKSGGIYWLRMKTKDYEKMAIKVEDQIEEVVFDDDDEDKYL